jgi:acyl-CoA thioester hydrolase
MMNNRNDIPLDGWIDAETCAHIYPLKVQYEDTDAGGVVYHANYLGYAERARSAGFTLMDIDQRQRLSDGKAFVVAGLDIRYHKPARLGDILTVVTKTERMTGAQVILNQQVMSADDINLATLTVKVVYATLDGRPIRLDKDVKNKILATMPPQNHDIQH